MLNSSKQTTADIHTHNTISLDGKAALAVSHAQHHTISLEAADHSIAQTSTPMLLPDGTAKDTMATIFGSPATVTVPVGSRTLILRISTSTRLRSSGFRPRLIPTPSIRLMTLGSGSMLKLSKR